jgi:hypothetical protein
MDSVDPEPELPEKSNSFWTSIFRQEVHGIHIHAIHPHRDVLKALEGVLHRLSFQPLRIAPLDVRIAALFRCQRIELMRTIQFSL